MTRIGKSSRAFASSTCVAECPDAYGHTTFIVDPGLTPAEVLIGGDSSTAADRAGCGPGCSRRT